MNRHASLPHPLNAPSFYILLTLSRSSMHAYALKGAISNYSLGSIRPTDAMISKTLHRLQQDGLIDMVGLEPAGKSGVARKHYQASELGLERLRDEMRRMDHALKIADAVAQLSGKQF